MKQEYQDGPSWRPAHAELTIQPLLHDLLVPAIAQPAIKTSEKCSRTNFEGLHGALKLSM